MNAFLTKNDGLKEDTQTKVIIEEEERDDIFNNMNKKNGTVRSNSSSPKAAGGIVGKESQHSDFYYKLEALNEKIRLFTEVFYDTKRDNLKRKNQEILRERHRLIL